MRSSFKIIIRVVTVLVRNQRFLPSEKIRAVNFQGILEAIFFSNKGQFSNLSCEHNWSASPFVDLSIPIVHPLAGRRRPGHVAGLPCTATLGGPSPSPSRASCSASDFLVPPCQGRDSHQRSLRRGSQAKASLRRGSPASAHANAHVLSPTNPKLFLYPAFTKLLSN